MDVMEHVQHEWRNLYLNNYVFKLACISSWVTCFHCGLNSQLTTSRITVVLYIYPTSNFWYNCVILYKYCRPPSAALAQIVCVVRVVKFYLFIIITYHEPFILITYQWSREVYQSYKMVSCISQIKWCHVSVT